jgi:hypothetical protein
MNNGKDPRHGIIRSDFPGGWQGDDRDAFRGIALTEHEAEAQLFLRHLINWRKKCSAVHTGELMHFAPENDEEIYTLFRWNSEEIIMLIMNRGNEEKNVNLEKYQEIIAGYSQAINVLTSELIEFKGSRIALQKHSVILLSIKH